MRGSRYQQPSAAVCRNRFRTLVISAEFPAILLALPIAVRVVDVMTPADKLELTTETLVVFAAGNRPEDVVIWRGSSGHSKGSYFAGVEGNVRNRAWHARDTPVNWVPSRSTAAMLVAISAHALNAYFGLRSCVHGGPSVDGHRPLPEEEITRAKAILKSRVQPKVRRPATTCPGRKPRNGCSFRPLHPR